jgi:predicted transcriptional regulator
MASTTTLKLPEELKARIAELAAAEGISPHAFMVDALAQQADRAERRREYLAAGDAALHEYQRTGIAYAMEDVEKYIVALAHGSKTTRPKPVKRTRKS